VVASGRVLGEQRLAKIYQEHLVYGICLILDSMQPRTPLNQSGDREVRDPQASNFAKTMAENLARAKASLLAARSRQKLFADERRRLS
jgi:hypothetical protein